MSAMNLPPKSGPGPALEEGANDDFVLPEIPGWLAPKLDSPTFRLMILAKEMDRLTSRQLGAEFGLTYAEWRVLSRLAIHGELTVRQVAELASVDRAEVSRAAPSLERRGLSGRHPGRSRIPLLFCTEAGRATFEEVAKARAEFHRALTIDLDEMERRQFDRSIHMVGLRLAEMRKAREEEKD
jgi:DNA-binding MarR family transcriptional regulator